MNIVFFGSSSYVIPILKVLRKNFDLKLVLTTEKNPTDAVPSFCIKNKIPYLPVANLSNSAINHELSTINPVVGVLADFGLIIPPAILNLFPKGIINIHPSILPKYRGPTPVQTAILEGVKTTGVSIIKLDEEVDHGPLLTQMEEKILPNDTSESLYERLFKISSGSIVQTIELYLKGDIKPQEQNHKEATFTNHLTRQSGFIDISNLKNKISKLKPERMIRAYFPWPGVWTKWKMKNGKWKILKFLPDNKLQVEGKKPMSYKDFINGYPEGKEILKIIK